MKRVVTAALLATGIALATSAATIMPAAAATGNENFHGTIVVSGTSGTRTVISSVVVAKGVFNGVGQVVETDSQAGDPPFSSRDDLVFAEGTMHLLSIIVDFSMSPPTPGCLAQATIQQIGEIQGGTGQFANASGTAHATVSGPALLPRNPDGSCDTAFDQPSLHEVDMFTSSGTLSF